MEINDVIFLGAGVSAAEGAPVQSTLFHEFFSLPRCERQISVSPQMDRRLRKFLKTFFGLSVRRRNVGDYSFPTFEEILGVLELALSRGESFKDYGQTPIDPKIQQVREDLIFMIAATLDQKLRGQGVHHRRLIERLRDEGKLLQTAFVSLNYDILIDNALADLYPDFDLDYGMEFTNFQRARDWHRPDPEKSVRLYKLHGSLNWLLCPACISLTLTPKKKRVASLALSPSVCDNCDSKMVPIIIPPSFFKVMSNYHLQQVWHKAEISFRPARRFFFCGYSFPDADIHVKYLLKRVETSKSLSPDIYIINNHDDKSEHEKREEELRYKRFFKDASRVHYTNRSFEEFSNGGVY